MSDDQKSPAEDTPESAPEEQSKDTVTNIDSDGELDQKIINPMHELIRSMRSQDETVRTTMAALKRLYKQSKGRGQASLTELMQLFSALYGLYHCGQNQNLIVSNQVTCDLDRQRWHLRALQELLIEHIACSRLGAKESYVPAQDEELEDTALKGISHTVVEEEKKMLRERVDELFREEKEKTVERRKKAIEKHKDTILEGAVETMKRPALKKEAPPKEDEGATDSKIIQLPS